MNAISVFGKMMSKVEFFDYVFEVFMSLEYAVSDEMEQKLASELSVLRSILRSCGWMDEYQQWVADGAGAAGAAAEMSELIKACPAA